MEPFEGDREELQTKAAAAVARQVILFAVGRERFALPLDDISEIFRIDEITPLPLSPAFLTGVINVHGNLASVISLARVLLIDDAREGELVLLVVPEKGGFALQVDQTIGFTRYTMLEEVTRDAARRGGKVSFVEGVFRSGDELFSLVSIEKLRIWIDAEFTKGED